MQRALHSVRMVALPRWSVTFTGAKTPHATETTLLGMSPVPRQHTCQSWCTTTQPAEDSINKENPVGSQGAERQCSPSQKLHNFGKYTEQPSCLKAEKGMYTAHKIHHACKLQSVLPDTWQSPGIPNLCKPALQLKKTEPRMQFCFPPTFSSSFGLILAQMSLGHVMQQIGKLIKLRTSLEFWHYMDVVICERTTLPMQSVGSRDPVKPSRWKAGQLGLIQKHPTSCFHPSWWETQLQIRSSSEPHNISNKCA